MIKTKIRRLIKIIMGCIIKKVQSMDGSETSPQVRYTCYATFFSSCRGQKTF